MLFYVLYERTRPSKIKKSDANIGVLKDELNSKWNPYVSIDEGYALYLQYTLG